MPQLDRRKYAAGRLATHALPTAIPAAALGVTNTRRAEAGVLGVGPSNR